MANMHASYPLAERDPNISGRTSRASNMSTGSKGKSHYHSTIYRKPVASGAKKSDLLSAAPGVTGMLRTTTEIGDVALLPFNNKKFGKPVRPQGLNRRNGTASRQSSSSASSQQRRTPSYHRAWLSNSSPGRQRSMTSSITRPPQLDHTHLSSWSNKDDSPFAASVAAGFAVNRNSGRSLSLSNATMATPAFHHNRSLSSLRSRIEPVRRPLSPGFRYPARLRRPGLRSASPALSELSGPPTNAQLAGSRLNPTFGRMSPSSVQPAPLYSANRNRSAPTIATLARHASNQTLRGHGLPIVPREDTASLSDHSSSRSHAPQVRTLRRKGSTATSFSKNTRSAHSVGRKRSSPSLPPSAPATPPMLEMPIPMHPMPNAPIKTENLNNDVTALDGQHVEGDDLEKEVTEIYQSMISDVTPMPLGFVQRIRSLLEAMENSVLASEHRASVITTLDTSGMVLDDTPDVIDVPPLNPKRITRELILKALAPSSEDSQTTAASIEPPPLQSEESSAAKSTSVTTEDRAKHDHIANDSEQSISQSLYSRPTNYTDNSEEIQKSSVVPPVPAISPTTTYGMPINARHRLETETGIQTDKTAPVISNDATPAILLSSHVEMPEPTIKQARRRWSIMPLRASDAPRITAEPQTRGAMSKKSGDNLKIKRGSSLKRQHSASSLSGLFQGRTSTERQHVAASTIQSTDIGPMKLPAEANDAAIHKHVQISLAVPGPYNVRPGSSAHSATIGLHQSVAKNREVARAQLTHEVAQDGQGGAIDALLADWPVHGTSQSIQVQTMNMRTNVQDTIPEHAEVDRFNMIRKVYEPLPGVKEESESRSDLRSMASSFAGPASRLSNARSNRDSVRQSAAEVSTKDTDSTTTAPKTFSVFKPTSSNLANLYAIPSMNFSCANLFSKLNEALGITVLADPAREIADDEARHSSATMREKYRSLFLTLDDMASEHEELAELASTHQAEILEQLAEIDKPEENMGSAEQCQKPRVPTMRPLSPHELIEEVNRLSVPSVGALTQRLSEFFPTLKRYFSDRPQTVKPNLPSLQELSGVDGLASPIVVGSEDAVQRSNKPMGNDSTVSRLSRAHLELSDVFDDSHHPSSELDKRRHSAPSSHDGMRPDSKDNVSANGKSPRGSPDSRMRSMSDSVVDLSPPGRLSILRRPASGSPQSSLLEGRPWNKPSSYPWTDSIPSIDIKFPRAPTPLMRTPELTLSQRQLRSPLRACQSISGSPVELDKSDVRCGDADPLSTASVHRLSTTTIDLVRPRVHNRLGLLGALSRRVLMPVPILTTSPKRSSVRARQSRKTHRKLVRRSKIKGAKLSHSSVFDKSHDQSQEHLITPATPRITARKYDDVQSCFSDDSSANLRRRLRPRNAKERSRSVTPKISISNVKVQPASSTGLSLKGVGNLTVHPFASAVEPQDSLTSGEAAGANSWSSPSTITPFAAMDTVTSTEARTRKLVERFKLLLLRSGELLRTMSHRKRRIKIKDDEGWSDKGESYADLAVGALNDLGAPTIRPLAGGSRTTSLLTSPGV